MHRSILGIRDAKINNIHSQQGIKTEWPSGNCISPALQRKQALRVPASPNRSISSFSNALRLIDFLECASFREKTAWKGSSFPPFAWQGLFRGHCRPESLATFVLSTEIFSGPFPSLRQLHTMRCMTALLTCKPQGECRQRKEERAGEGGRSCQKACVHFLAG